MSRALRIAALPLALTVSACAGTADETALIADPYEPANRVVHTFNTGIDVALIRPASQAYGAIVPEPMERGIENFVSNLSLPGDMVNNALQGDGDGFSRNLGRFLMNSTLGLGGFLDVAGDNAIERVPADFGQTLAVYGVQEGPYVELPLLGPSTTRDAVGTVVDIVTNPLALIDSDTATDVLVAGTTTDIVDTRDELGGTLDAILYESEDSYVALRDVYIQNRRAFVNGTEGGTEGFVDIYAE
ncbi:VacJ family lipoprotein [Roseobacter sp. HKCCA0434]|uniref:MlaA family lipoprotein n=1 Tax=Roseobacter sp. HKCCA0434 TaxID=3079297 RepID=UPI002905B43E|nr:VacJ family lipoprotein [Roseobacter sp. HKCCA0434]